MDRKNILKFLTFLLITASVISFESSLVFAAAPTTLEDAEILAEGIILAEETTGKIIYQENSDKRMYPASTTKIMTAVIAMEYLQMDEIYVLGDEINQVPLSSSKAGHLYGESILGINLIRGLMIPSGNESAMAIAKIVVEAHEGKTISDFNEITEVFAKLMNDKAKELGCKNTNFVTPHGFHDENHYTTPEDMLLIVKEYLKNDTLREVSGEKAFKGNGAGDKATEDMKTVEYDRANSNSLLSSNDYAYEYATGLKTGWTDEAGRCLVSTAEKDGEKLICIQLFSDDPQRWEDAILMFEYAFSNYSYNNLVSTRDAENSEVDVKEIDNPQLGTNDTMRIFSKESFMGYFSDGELKKIVKTIRYNEDKIIKITDENEVETEFLKTPIVQNEVIGEIIYTLDGAEVFKSEIVAERDALERNLKSDILFFIDLIRENMFTSKAIPFWIGFAIILILIIILIINIVSKRREKKTLDLRKSKRRW